LEEQLDAKTRRLKELVGKSGRAAVAVSGGVDSTYLARIACDVLGNKNFLAVFARSPLLTSAELDNVLTVTDEIGCRLHIVDVDPLAWPEFIDNPRDRCYLCKKKIYSLFIEAIRQHDIAVLMDGTNADDLNDYRPGLRALRELDVKTPLAEAGLGKAEIRQLSRRLALSNWDRPSASCLATRIPTGIHITQDLLDRVAQCENHLHKLGFKGCRVRLFGKEAQIELAEGDSERFVRAATRNSVLDFFRMRGINKVLLNIQERK